MWFKKENIIKGLIVSSIVVFALINIGNEQQIKPVGTIYLKNEVEVAKVEQTDYNIPLPEDIKQKMIEEQNAKKEAERIAREKAEEEERQRIAAEQAAEEERQRQEALRIAKTKEKITSRSETTRAVSGTVAEYQAYAREVCSSYGWSDYDYQCLVNIVNHESGWNVTAKNPSSGAYGLFQSLPASKMASCGSDYLTNYKTQIQWGCSYISGRYGTPSNAWDFWCSHNWY